MGRRNSYVPICFSNRKGIERWVRGSRPVDELDEIDKGEGGGI